jgi:hypothetical protein
MAGGGVGDFQATWRAFLAASYFNIPRGECVTCRNGNSSRCGLYFCVQCKVGGVCRATFEEGGGHAHHPHLRVWRVTLSYVVWVEDLRRFMPRELVDQIQLYTGNERLNCKFFKPNNQTLTAAQASRLRVCHGCGSPISASSTRNLSDSPVCSLECLLDLELRRRRPTQRRPKQNEPPRQRRRKQNKDSIVRLEYSEYAPHR